MLRHLVIGFATLLLVGLMGVESSQATSKDPAAPKYLHISRMWFISTLSSDKLIFFIERLLISNGFVPVGSMISVSSPVAFFKKGLSVIVIDGTSNNKTTISATEGDGLQALKDLALILHVPVHEYK